MFKIKYLILSLVGLTIVALAGPIYHFLMLPSERMIDSSKNVKDAFGSYQIVTDEIIASSNELPPKAFMCAVCYPEQLGSASCEERIKYWISKNIASGGDPEKQIWRTLKSAVVGKTLGWKYSDDMLYRLYVTFANRPLKSTDITSACNQRFNKNCADLNGEESVKLEAEVRSGNANTDTIQVAIMEKCAR